MEKITHSQLLDIIKNSPGALPVGIVATTDAKARKTGNPFGDITKRVRAVGWVGVNYEKSVERQSGGGEFRADPLPWGEWVVPNKIIGHKGGFYLRTQTAEGNRRRQPARVLSYRGQDGRFLSRDDVAPFLPPVTESRKQKEAGLSGAQKQVWVRTYAFASLERVRVGGKTFLIES